MGLQSVSMLILEVFMKVSVYPTRNCVEERDIKDRITVVIDVLRATTTIITALYNGCKGSNPCSGDRRGGEHLKNYDKDTYILGGERYAEKIEGFHLSNSPWEYNREAVEGKTVVFTTTNGTRAITKAGDAKKTILGSFTNISEVCRYLGEQDEDIAIVCAGTEGRFSTDDVLAAGALVYGLINDVAQRPMIWP